MNPAGSQGVKREGRWVMKVAAVTTRLIERGEGVKPGGHIRAGDSSDQSRLRPRPPLSSSTDPTGGESDEFEGLRGS